MALWTWRTSLAWPDRFFPFFFVVAEKRVWSGSQMQLVLAPRKVTIKHVIVAQVYGRVRLLFDLSHFQFVTTCADIKHSFLARVLKWLLFPPPQRKTEKSGLATRD